jgi:hypothetical protein
MSSTSSRTHSIGPKQFPWKVHEMLETAEKNGDDHVVSWLPDGRSFRVHERDLFVDGMMKVFFNQTKYKSFQRQLNLWGFVRISNRDPTEKGGYFHPLFLKGRRDLCPCMTRQKTMQAQGPTASRAARQSIPVVSNNTEVISSTGSTDQSLNAQAMLATRNMSNSELIAMLVAGAAQAAPASQSFAPSSGPKDILDLQQALRNQLFEQTPVAVNHNANEQLALLLQRGLEMQATPGPDLHFVAAMLARKREQEAELSAILALRANINWS